MGFSKEWNKTPTGLEEILKGVQAGFEPIDVGEKQAPLTRRSKRRDKIFPNCMLLGLPSLFLFNLRKRIKRKIRKLNKEKISLSYSYLKMCSNFID